MRNLIARKKDALTVIATGRVVIARREWKRADDISVAFTAVQMN